MAPILIAMDGSSPRMRGAPWKQSYTPSGQWIIPADAGSTLHMSPDAVFRKDHPRGCGEHWLPLLAILLLVGSSPWMRGAPHRGLHVLLRFGIIPADAGNTGERAIALVMWKDHPRGCGEHMPCEWGRRNFRGSSPRMRGARQHVHEGVPFHGIIPADAGSTRSSGWHRTG